LIKDILALLTPLAEQRGADIQVLLEEFRSKREEERRELAERLQQSVLPLFVYRRGHPSTLGSCVLVRLDTNYYVFTAGHVLRDAGAAPLWFPPRGKGEKFRRIPQMAGFTLVAERNDVGVLLLPSNTFTAFEHRKFFLARSLVKTTKQTP